MKRYLIEIKSPRGTVCNIGYYADTPNKNYRVYYCGSDTGLRYERIGNAARHLNRMAGWWSFHGVTGIECRYGTIDEIPRRGSNA